MRRITPHRRPPSVIWVLLSILLVPNPAEAADYHVAATGDDAADGTAKSPFRTLKKGITVLKPGDTLYVANGTYQGVIERGAIPSGDSWDKPVTVAARPGHRPVIVPRGEGAACLSIVETRFFVVDGFVLDAGSHGKGVTITESPGFPKSRHIELRNCEIMNSNGQGIATGGVGCRFINLDVHDNGANGIDLQGEGHLIDGGKYFRNVRGGIHAHGNATNTIVRGVRTFENGATGLAFVGGDTNQALNNFVYGNASGIQLSGESPRCFNNTVYHNKTEGLSIQADGTQKADVRNNIVFQNGTDITDHAKGTVLSHNLTSDPKFANTAAADFRLQDGSSAIDMGVDLRAQGVTSDFEGQVRPQGRAFDIGADESLPPPDKDSPRKLTKVVAVAPRDKADVVDGDAVVQIHFSVGLTIKSITVESVRLLDSAGKPADVRLGSDLEGDVVTLRPLQRLKPEATYTLEILDKLLDKHGAPVAPFRSSFTTGSETTAPIQAAGFQFAKTKVDAEHGPTAIAVGPDGHVYVATYQGVLYRLRIDPQTGLATGKDRLLTLEGRKILGLAFDPEATAAAPVAWITYDDRKAENENVGTFSGVLSRVRIPPAGRDEDAVETKYIIGLPSGWHPLNGCTFGPDKRVYISVGSMNRLGEDPLRPETLLSAAVIVADVRDSNFNSGVLPLNAQTTAPVRYNPYAADAPLKLYATGFRQMYRVCWHSSGNLYGGVNQNDGVGRSDTPAFPGVPSLRSVFPDEDLVRIVEDGYYGHPNPSRKQYVLLGGNPTAGEDPWEVPEYPIGTQPHRNFNPANLIFNLASVRGTSANGCTEYTLPGPLRGRLLICFYEGTQTINTFAFNPAGTAVTDSRPLLDENRQPLRFAHPLDVAVHPGGRIYVADFGDWSTFGGGGTIWALSGLGSK